MKGTNHHYSAFLLLCCCLFIATTCAGKKKVFLLKKTFFAEVVSLKAAGGITLLIDTKLGNYSVLVDLKVWFQSGVTALHTSEGWFAANVKSKTVEGDHIILCLL
jgi:hypothetical protein